MAEHHKRPIPMRAKNANRRHRPQEIPWMRALFQIWALPVRRDEDRKPPRPL